MANEVASTLRQHMIILIAGLIALAGIERTLAVPTQSAPWAVGVNPQTARIYVGHISHDSVSVIDGTTNTVLTNIPVGNAPTQGITVNPVTNLIYVAPSNCNCVPVIDGTTNTVIATVPMGIHYALWIAVNPETNRIYVSHRDDSGFSVIDGRINSVIATVPVEGSIITGIGVNASTNRIYVAQPPGVVSVIDGSTHEIVVKIPVADRPGAIGINRITNRIYVANSLPDIPNDLVTIIDGETHAVIAAARVGDIPSGVEVNESTNRVYVSNYGSDFASVIDGVTNKVLTTLPTGPNGSGLGTDSLSDRVYIAMNQLGSSGNVSVLFGRELLKNPSLERDADQDGVPDVWRGKHLAGDVLMRDPYEGRWAFEFIGAAGVTKRLTQQVSVAGVAGTTLRLEAFSKADGASGMGGSYQVKVKVVFNDDSVRAFAVNFGKSTHDWERGSASFTAPKDFKRLIVNATYANQAGRARFDGLHLWTE